MAPLKSRNPQVHLNRGHQVEYHQTLTVAERYQVVSSDTMTISKNRCHYPTVDRRTCDVPFEESQGGEILCVTCDYKPLYFQEIMWKED